MEKQYKKINSEKIEETTTHTRIIERQMVEDELKMTDTEIQRMTERKKELEELLKQFK